MEYDISEILNNKESVSDVIDNLQHAISDASEDVAQVDLYSSSTEELNID